MEEAAYGIGVLLFHGFIFLLQPNQTNLAAAVLLFWLVAKGTKRVGRDLSGNFTGDREPRKYYYRQGGALSFQRTVRCLFFLSPIAAHFQFC